MGVDFQSLFSGKIRKIFQMSYAEIIPSMLSVKFSSKTNNSCAKKGIRSKCPEILYAKLSDKIP